VYSDGVNNTSAKVKAKDLPFQAKYAKPVASSHEVWAKDIIVKPPKDCADVLRNYVNFSEKN